MHKPEPVLRAVAAGIPRAQGEGARDDGVGDVPTAAPERVSFCAHVSGCELAVRAVELAPYLFACRGCRGGAEEEEEVVGELSVFLEDPKRKWGVDFPSLYTHSGPLVWSGFETFVNMCRCLDEPGGGEIKNIV